MNITVSDQLWLRGEGPSDSYLLRERDGKMCFTGFCAIALGARAREIRGKKGLFSLPSLPYGTHPALYNISHIHSKLEKINDSQILSDAQRKAELAHECEKLGFNVIFNP